jgi:beta-phosphoglucomutase-like phosphatase (HAD superfamily)
MLQAIVFDFDGVVVDSEPLHYQAFVLVGKSIGFEFTYDEYLATYIGFDDRDAFRVMLEAAGQDVTPGRVAELCRVKQDAFDTVVQAAAANGGQGLAIPGALALIDEVAAAGLPRAIASGATRADIELMLGLLGKRDRFETIVTADDVERSKPDPASYTLAAERLGLAPGNCLAIEDTAAGLRSATDAGMMTLGLTTTGPAEPLATADRVIDDLQGVDLAQLRAWYT